MSKRYVAKKYRDADEYICMECNNKFLSSIGKKFCSKECAKLFLNKNIDRGITGISPATKGAIGELAVCVDLMSKGYSVFRSMSPSCKFDLIAYMNDKVHKIEVRCGITNKATGITSFQKKT